MANTNATTSYRAKWFSSQLQQTLKAALVAEKICAVDRTDGKYIWNPYGDAPTTVVQAIIGTYVPATYTSTDDTLTVTYEFIVSEHIYDFEKVMQNGDIFASRMDEMVASAATAIDKYVLNALCDAGTGSYSTPPGGFSQANVPIIVSNLLSKVAGYAGNEAGTYLALEAQDIPGFVQAGAAQGFSFADSWLRNGFMSNYMGVELYVKPNSTFVTATIGAAFTNSGHRVFGVKGISTYAAPRGIQYEEKSIGASTGKEVVCWGYVGFKAWYAKLALTVDITVTA
jgi:hypothetical protein